MSIQGKSIHLQGRVQQVGFRYYVYRLASELGVKGFVKNMPDGSISVEAECDSHTMEVFIEHCKKGSPQSKVSKCEATPIEVKGYECFKIF
ncbi:MAG: acylphosphatase [Bacteroidales bacterium]|nr:MAG: acylphosphatase [Bacteroidales bacterium]